jgi:hypothetical protein
MHCGYQDHSFLNPGLSQNVVHLIGDVYKLAVLFGVEPQVFCVKSHGMTSAGYQWESRFNYPGNFGRPDRE